jgi:GLPGLI family protein
MKKLSLLIILSVTITSLMAQARFVQAGKIEFERKINVHRQVDPSDEEGDWFKEFIKQQPKFHTTYFDLYFNGSKTMYKPGRETDDNRKQLWFIGPSKDNLVATDMETGYQKSMKTIFEATYLLQDTSRRLDWKLENEIRTIAGFDCRKAVARICDSVYVVAFYTEEILVNGGPESFNGLPGMILGIAIPRLYTTWYATKLELMEPAAKDLDFNAKGKKVTEKDLEATLQKSLKDWGKQAAKNIWWVML